MLALAVLLLAGCRLEVTAELDLREDASGTAVLELFLDRDLLGLLDELGVDPVGEVEAAADQVADWEVEIVAAGADGLRLRLEHDGPDPAAALGELTAGLAEDDPALWSDLAVGVHERDDGGDDVELAGTVRLDGPRAPGVIDATGESLGPDADELARLTAEHVSGSLVVTLPGTVQAHDADAADGSTLRWELPVDREVGVHARSAVSSLPVPREVLVAGAAVLVVLTLALAWTFRRRRR